MASHLLGCAPSDTRIEAPVTPLVEGLSFVADGAALTPHLVVPLPDGRYLADTDDGLFLVPADLRSASRIGEADELGALRTVSLSGSIAILVGESAVLALDGTALFRVPVESMLGASDVRAMAAVPRVDDDSVLDWLVATDAGVFLVRDESARSIEVDGASIEAVAMATSTEGSAWIAEEHALLHVFVEGDDVRVERLARVGTVTDVACTASGLPWWVEDGGLHAVGASSRVIVHALGTTATGLSPIDGSDALWVHGVSGADATLHYFDGYGFHAVEHDLGAADVRCATDDACVALDAGRAELVRVRHAVTLEGLEDGASIHESTNLTVTVDDADALATLEARVGATKIAVEEGAFSIAPSDVGYGARTLVVTATFDDGTLPTELERDFTAEPPATWSDDVSAIYEAACSTCHGPSGPSSRRLDSREAWVSEYALLLPAIQSGAMPLGASPLSDETIQLIEAWADAGFPE